MLFKRIAVAAACGVAVVAMSGCVLAPKGTVAERAAADAAGRPFEPPVGKRVVPELPPQPTWQAVLSRAFLTNGELEAKYFEWRAALARVTQKSTWPDSNISVGYSYMFSPQRMKTFDRQTFSVGFDPMQNLSIPTRTMQAGRVALDEARAAGERFRAAKFELQNRVMQAYLDYALLAEKVRVERRNIELLKLLTQTAADRLQAGGQEQDLLKAQIELRLAENRLKDMEAELPQVRARLNALVDRPATAPLEPPAELPAARVVQADDAKLLAIGTEENPELTGLAADVAGRRDALELARMQWLPDINPTAAFTGGLSQTIGAMVTLPTTIPIIRAAIDEARANLRGSEAMLRQTRRDRAATYVATLYAMRNNERQIALVRDQILPAAEQLLAASRQAYTTGSVPFADLIDSQRTLLDTRLMLAEARVAREKRLADLEQLAGVDLETLGPAASSRPTTEPATAPSNNGEHHHE